jgi:hypothetical protein
LDTPGVLLYDDAATRRTASASIHTSHHWEYQWSNRVLDGDPMKKFSRYRCPCGAMFDHYYDLETLDEAKAFTLKGTQT